MQSCLNAARNVAHVLVETSEMCPCQPWITVDEQQVEGTAFPVRLPGRERLCFITNFHVVEDCRHKNSIQLATAQRGMDRVSASVVFVIPKLDIAILETTSEELPVDALELETNRVECLAQMCYTVGFPEGLTLQRQNGYISGWSPDIEDHIVLNMSLNSGNSGGPIIDASTGRVIAVAT